MFNKESVPGTLTVAFLVCLVCAIVVATAAVSLRPVQQKNQLLDKQTNVLQAAGLYEPGMDVAAEFEKIERRFVELETGEYVEREPTYDMRRAARDPADSYTLSQDQDVASIRRVPRVAEVFLARDASGELSRIILPVHGYGLWSTLYGFLALEPDANTVAGLGFYEHAETPGLGGEVDNPRWKALWPGKRLFDENGELAIRVIKGTVDESAPDAIHRVDGLAGATLTTNGVNNLVRFWVGENGFGPYLDRLRAGSEAAVDGAPSTEDQASASAPVTEEEVSRG